MTLSQATGTRAVTITAAGGAYPAKNLPSGTSSMTLNITDTPSGASPPTGVWGVAVVRDNSDPVGNYTVTGNVLAYTAIGTGGSLPASVAISVPERGTFRIVLTVGNSAANAQNMAAVNTGGTSTEYHDDSDGNSASGGLDLTSIAGTRVDGYNWRNTKLASRSYSVAGTLGYPSQFTITVGFDTGTYINPKAIKVGLKTTGADGAPQDGIYRPTPSTAGSATTATINVDTDFLAASTPYFLHVAIGAALGESIQAGETPDFLASGTITGTAADQRHWLQFDDGAQTLTGFTGSSNDKIASNAADKTIGSGIIAYKTASKVTPGTTGYENHSYATLRNPAVYRRTQPTASQSTGSTPGIEAFVTDIHGTLLSGVSISMAVLRHTDSAQEGSTSTAATGTGGTVGRRRMDFTVANSHIAFNRFKKTSPDNPLSPPSGGAIVGVAANDTTLGAGGLGIGGSTFVVGSIANLYPGCRIRINPGGGSEEDFLISTLDPGSNTVTTTTTANNSHSSGETIRRVFPTYPKAVLFTGNAFSGVKEPTVTYTAQFGVNSEVIFSDIWTGTSTAASLNGAGEPTGAGQREQTLGAGSLKSKLTSLINEGTGKINTFGAHNPRDIQRTPVVVATDNLYIRRAQYNQTLGTIDDSGTSLNDAQTKLDTSLGYNTNNNSVDTIPPPTDPSSLFYWLGAADTTGQRTTLSLTSGPSIGFTGDTGNYGYFQQSVSFIAIDTTTIMVVTSEVVQSDPTLSRRFTIKMFRITADDDFVDVFADAAPLFVVYSQPATAGTAMTELTRGTATAIDTPPTANYEFFVTMPLSVASIRVFVIAKVNGSRIIGGDKTSVQVGYSFDPVGTFTGLNFK